MPVTNIIPFELPLPQILPTIEGNVDYRDFRDQLLRINGLLVQSPLETQMLEADLQRWLAGQKRVSAKAQQKHQFHARRALRCNTARLLPLRIPVSAGQAFRSLSDSDSDRCRTPNPISVGQ